MIACAISAFIFIYIFPVVWSVFNYVDNKYLEKKIPCSSTAQSLVYSVYISI